MTWSQSGSPHSSGGQIGVRMQVDLQTLGGTGLKLPLRCPVSPLAALAAVPESRHVNHVGLTPVVLTESTEALTYCATQGTVFSQAPL